MILTVLYFYSGREAYLRPEMPKVNCTTWPYVMEGASRLSAVLSSYMVARMGADTIVARVMAISFNLLY